jgi:predicted ArsR family transcriptional regulator
LSKNNIRKIVGSISWLPGAIKKDTDKNKLHSPKNANRRYVSFGILYFCSRTPMTAHEISMRIGLDVYRVRREISALLRKGEMVVIEKKPMEYKQIGRGRKKFMVRLYRAA